MGSCCKEWEIVIQHLFFLVRRVREAFRFFFERANAPDRMHTQNKRMDCACFPPSSYDASYDREQFFFFTEKHDVDDKLTRKSLTSIK